MGAVEAHQVLVFDDGADHAGNCFQRIIVRLIGDADGEHDAAFGHALVIADPAFEEVPVGKNQLLAG